ncbi:MAG: tRNA (adenosine(37)-N6)-dimethylallyltransferase MiaA [Pontiellaceae bacterium]|nr:tRNA (adenosine(37)-N6)-dimethylallyltransferase MiaA [Pontiellaceae bacterium]MBN2786338.1 tRNA (adenosine(37)-N6)-dimethylallyltransferase MiaA [Pontiellaceae bacterium]
MDSSGRHAFFLVGPTASGKSAVAQYIAERNGWRIVSADSMNLYRGMDVGTAKPSVSERALVDYAGVDLVDPTEKFSVAAYLEAVRPAFDFGQDVIVAGGTGLYVKCLTEGFDDVPPENEALRTELEALDFDDLERRARENAPDLFNALTGDDRRNPRRLIRILERENGWDGSPRRPEPGSWNVRSKPTIVGLRVEREVLVRRIGERVEKMYASGLLDEAQQLIDLKLSSTALQAIGYAEAFAVIRSEMTVDEAKEKTIIRTRQLAKRQMTWFRNQLNVEWIDTAEYPNVEKLAEAVSSAWGKSGPVSVRI